MAHLFTRVVVVGLVLAGIGAEPADAGTFHVYGLGMNGAGCPNGWHAQQAPVDRFRQGDFCSRWEIQSVREGALQRGAFAGASMFAGSGARFTGFSIKSYGTARNGMTWMMAMCQTPFTACTGWLPQSGTWSEREFRLGTLAGGSPVYAQQLWAGVSCDASSCPDSVSAGRAVQMTHVASHAVVDDYTEPGAPSFSGVSTGWNSGEKQLTYSASDAGSGVESTTLTIDGSLQRTNKHSCSRLSSGGYTQPVPCALSTGGTFTLNQPGQLADGRHTLSVRARDAGDRSTARTQEFWVDNNAPGHPIDLEVEGGDGWRSSNDFAVTWENPDQGNGSDIVGAYYRIGSAPETGTDGTRVRGESVSRIEDLRVARDGNWTLHVWLEDEAGNKTTASVAEASLRLDTTAPSLAFQNERSAPAEVRVETSDKHSGVRGGLIQIRRRGVADWQSLDTRREGTDLVATIPDEQFERGTYELQATAVDAVGNWATTNLRQDGREMVIDLPLRADTTLSATLARGADGAGRAGPQVRVGYRKRAWVRGVLRSGAALLPDTRVAIETRRLPSGDWQPLTELVTDGNGRYRVQLPRGVSREVRVRFPGNRSLRPADDMVTLLVRGWAKLRLQPRSLRRGGTITFRGHVGLFRARTPQAGKLIQIQFLDGRKWRPAVKLGHTDEQGRFRIRYRFRRISRPTRILFRILVPAEGGWPYATGASRVQAAFVRP